VGRALALATGLLALPASARACTCAQSATADVALERAQRVFLGTVERFEVRDTKRVATIRVKTVWKGPRQSRVRVTTGGGDADCGFHFVAGLDYVVYASERERGGLTTSICDRTARPKDARDDLSVLGGGVRLQ
jgi:hypothetical protein